MANFTLHDLAARVKERAQASPDVSYTRKLLDRGIAHCAKKLGEEAVETDDRGGCRGPRAPDRRDRRSPLPSAGRAGGARRHARRGRSRACRAHRPVRPRREGLAASASKSTPKSTDEHGPARRHRALALPHLLARRMGGAARRHADDAAAGRDRPAALAQRPARHRRGRGNLPAAVAAPVACTWRRPSACTWRSSASSAPRTPRCPTSSASAARSRSASRPRRACCRRCWRAGPTCPRSISSPPTAFSTRTPSSSAKA